MSETTESVTVLQRALDQAGDLVAAVHEGQLDRPTPCTDWDVRRLATHLLAAPRKFLAAAQGQDVDWSTDPAPPESGWAEAFREAADDLVHHWHQQDESAGSADWMTAEFAVHGWDLARGLGRPSSGLDPDVAERALAFMSQGLTPENRGDVFAPEQPAPEGAGPYERLAAYAGRPVD
ncbi:TIGR03086 family metal-binding protein [Nocardioides euryhalodurans]|uniref:TIGR03086 family protein n=1 Tax=Nocardioides euryhalodurans TaxID=2518370 RepID=A0A4P7GJG3_9ACTN|nr:TIGR03086 family metal-binding protein [Nocardioides euryhalodurans]QBR91899.1 TIGR03086 family protein [Nocardioides euryhalodurans]